MKYDIENRHRLGALFLVGQLATIFGIVVGLVGFVTNFIVVILGLVLCTSGISVTKFSKSRYFGENGMVGVNGNPRVDDKWMRLSSFLGYVSITLAVIFLWFMFGDKSTAYRSPWPVYGFLASVAFYMLTVVCGSVYFACVVFFKKRGTGKAD